MPGGYYCPSPVFEFIVGNAYRGYIQTKKPKKHFEYEYIKNSNSQLIEANRYVFHNNSVLLVSKEFILYKPDENIEAVFLFSEDDIVLESVGLCRYNNNHEIRLYATLTNTYAQFSNTINKTSFDYHSEAFTYGKKLEFVEWIDNVGDMTEKFGFRFIYENEKLVSYKNVYSDTNIEYRIPKNKLHNTIL